MANKNRTDNCLAGSESEYDFQGDGWEDLRSCSCAQVWFMRMESTPAAILLDAVLVVACPE